MFLKSFFTKGDKIKIVCDTNQFTDTVIILQLIGFNHYKETGKSTFAGCVFHMMGVMDTTHRMNASNTNIDGWKESEMRTYLHDTIFPGLPIKWRKMIKDVDVLSSIGGMAQQISSSSNKLFCLSTYEVGLNTTTNPYPNEVDADAEDKIFPVFTNDYSRVRRKSNGTGTATIWWLRSPYISYSTNFMYVSASGSSLSSLAYSAYGVAWGFCL